MERCCSRATQPNPPQPRLHAREDCEMTMSDGGIGAELREAPDAIRRQSIALQPLRDLVARLRKHPPQVVLTCGRGSSAHAATFAKHLIERHLGIPVAAAAPN